MARQVAIMLDDLPHEGRLGRLKFRRGEVVKVASGFFRNFLEPKGLAKRYSGNLPVGTFTLQSELSNERDRLNREKLSRLTKAGPIAFLENANSSNRLYRTIKKKNIKYKIENTGIHIGVNDVILPENIKSLGIFNLSVHAFDDIFVNIQVFVARGADDLALMEAGVNPYDGERDREMPTFDDEDKLAIKSISMDAIKESLDGRDTREQHRKGDLRKEFDGMEKSISSVEGSLRAKIDEFEKSFNSQIYEIKSELNENKKSISDLKSEMNQSISDLKSKMDQSISEVNKKSDMIYSLLYDHFNIPER